MPENPHHDLMIEPAPHPPASESHQPGMLRHAFSKSSLLTLWLPLAATIGSIALAMLVFSGVTMDVLGFVFLAGLAWFLGLTIFRFLKKRIAAGLGALACLVVSGLSLALCLAIVLFKGLFEADEFAVGLSLPEGVELAEPASDLPFEREAGSPIDTFQLALRNSLSGVGSDNPTLTIRLDSLAALQNNHPVLLQRYLASHPGWRVFRSSDSHSTTASHMVQISPKRPTSK